MQVRVLLALLDKIFLPVLELRKHCFFVWRGSPSDSLAFSEPSSVIKLEVVICPKLSGGTQRILWEPGCPESYVVGDCCSPVANLQPSFWHRPATRVSFHSGTRHEPAVERLDECVIYGFARTTEVESDLIGIGPLVQCFRRELRVVVDSNLLGSRRLSPIRVKASTTSWLPICPLKNAVC